MADPTLSTEPPRCPFRACAAEAHEDVVGRGWDFEYDTTRDECSMVRCGDCALWHLAEVPAAEAMSTIYPDNYYAFSESGSENRLVKRVRDHLEVGKFRRYQELLPARGVRVLDVGCGDGRLLDLFRRHAPDDWELCGLEIGTDAATDARDKGYDIRVGDFEDLDVPAWAGRFDLVLMHQVIEHLRDPRRAVERVAALTRPEGIFSIETPDTDAWDARLFGRRHWGGHHFPRHFYLFRKSSLARLVGECGFEVASSRSLLSPVFWVHSLHNALVDRRHLARFARHAHYQNPLLLAAATCIDGLQIALTGRSSNQQLLARRLSETP